jgi:nucleoside-diphosphate-sugar epimerase
VTGAGGFIGGALVSLLAKDRFVRAALHRNCPTELLPEVHYVSSGLGDRDDWTSALTGVETVVHCAARVHVLRESSRDSLKEFRSINVKGTLCLANQAALRGVKRFVYLSSIGVHGDETSDRAFSEGDTPRPQSHYAMSKLEAEQGLREVSETSRMELVIIRPPSVYGPNAPGHFNLLMRCLRIGIPLPFRAVVNNRRSFIFIENLTGFLRLCIDHPRAAGETFVLRDGEDLSTASLAERLAVAMRLRDRLWFAPIPLLMLAGTVVGRRNTFRSLCNSLQVDDSKARRLLDWTPCISVEDALSRTVVPFRRASA